MYVSDIPHINSLKEFDMDFFDYRCVTISHPLLLLPASYQEHLEPQAALHGSNKLQQLYHGASYLLSS